ncbi:MAG: hypothetical protein G8345_15340, partial [Magnetococcales bacterium]|nr:hypothetical protein [Magnetococcales bacterium]
MSVTPWRNWRVLDKEEEQEKNKREALQNAARADEEYWIPINDWLLKGERRYKDPVTDADLLMFVGQKEHDTPPPPETFYTNFQAKNEVRSILSRKGLTHKRLDEMIAEYK